MVHSLFSSLGAERSLPRLARGGRFASKASVVGAESLRSLAVVCVFDVNESTRRLQSEGYCPPDRSLGIRLTRPDPAPIDRDQLSRRRSALNWLHP